MLLRVALYGGAVLIGLPAAFCHTLTRTVRQPVSPPPRGFEELRLAADGLRLRAWLRRGDPARASFVVVHGLGDSLESFTGAAGRLNARGHTVLLPDLRGHGASQGEVTTLGGREREDVRAGMERLRAEGLARGGLVLMGNSMGAVAVLLAAAGRDDVRAVIVEAPFDSYRETVAHHARLYYGLPRWLPLIPLTIAFAEWRAGFSADEVDTRAAARRIRAPILAIVDGADRRMPEPVVRRILEAHPGRHELWVAPGAPHVGAWRDREYWPRIFAFLEAAGV